MREIIKFARRFLEDINFDFSDVAQPGSAWRLGARAAGNMSFHVYILWSATVEKFYVGSTSDLEERFLQHNRGQSKFTLKGKPWNLIWSQQCADRTEAIRFENKIKKRGIRRHLEDINFDFSGCSAAR